MIDLKLIRENPEKIQKAAKDKNIDININHILEIDKKHKELSISVQKLREERNILTSSMKGKPSTEQIGKGKILKEKLEKEENALKAVGEELKRELLKIPNPAKPDVKVGKNDTENEVLKKVGTPTKFNFKPKDHLELGEALDIIDVKAAAKVSGARFDYLKNDGVLLEFALKQFAFDLLIREGFIPVIPPVLIKKEIMDELGYTQMGEEENIFSLDKDSLYLVGTSEQSIVPMLKDEVLEKEELPRRYVGFSTCFRREAGSYGKDTKGIFRVHQFDKVEMVSFVEEGQDDKEHEYLLSLEENLFKLLDIPYQVVRICTGDLGFNAARKYDIEAWIPSQNKYREVTSTSTVTDFQSRRLNIKYQNGNEKKYVQILNGTAFSMNRPIVAILENYQQEDGSVLIPKILQKYLNKEKIISKKV
ncbi:MAG: serine--tRNA ligase [Candidatus Levybacteria bacterium]|nr:serine--tRNA ligase [Candidatus Levybacteria bacterium]